MSIDTEQDWRDFKNGVINEDDVMDAQSLPKVEIPNRNGSAPAAGAMEARDAKASG